MGESRQLFGLKLSRKGLIWNEGGTCRCGSELIQMFIIIYEKENNAENQIGVSLVV